MRYWTHLFTGITWQQFTDAGADVITYPLRQWDAVVEIEPGDIILCHLLDSKSFIGILSVIEEAYQSTSEVWSGGENMPVRLPVKMLAQVDFENRVTIDSIKHRLSYYDDTDPLDAWDNHFTNPPISEILTDARIVVKAVGYSLKTRQADDMSEALLAQLTQTQEVLRVIHQQLESDDTDSKPQRLPVATAAGATVNAAGSASVIENIKTATQERQAVALDEHSAPTIKHNPTDLDIDEDDMPPSQADAMAAIPDDEDEPEEQADDVAVMEEIVAMETAVSEYEEVEDEITPDAPQQEQEPEISNTDGDETMARSTNEIQMTATHDDIQAYLYHVAHKMGLSVWVPEAVQHRLVDGQAFSTLDGVTAQLPDFGDPVVQDIMADMDMLWLNSENVVAAFEVEVDSQVEYGLMRINDLKLLLPQDGFMRVYVVAPPTMRERLRRALSRPTFASSPSNIEDDCRMIPFSALQQKIQQVDSLGVLRYLQPEFLDEISTSLKA